MLRQLFGIKIKDKVSLEKISTKTKAKRVGIIAKTLKLKYAGYLIRECDQKWNKTLTLWIPHTGKRSRGRPRTRWSDEINRELGTAWMTEAKNCQEWKSLVSTYAQEWVAEGVTSEGEAHLSNVRGRANVTPNVTSCN